MPYSPINSYGLIGNMRTAALVGPGASIDWLCLPRFDSPSIFGAILDDARGGRFSIHAHGPRVNESQYYRPDTNVFITRLSHSDGVGEVVDFMPAAIARHDRDRPDLVRIVRVEHGRMRFTLRCAPAFDYARARHRLTVNGIGAVFEAAGQSLALSSTVPLTAAPDGAVAAEFELAGGQAAVLSLEHGDVSALARDGVSLVEAEDLLHDTLEFWRRWLSQCTYDGRWREQVVRSALALKLLTYEPTGAIVAAPTCSLPEHIGGSRNWDYRYTWLRDAAFMIYALLRIGFTREAARFMDWLEQRCHELEPDGMLRPVYAVDGGRELPEQTLDHLEGYMGSRPVRIGNAAYGQLQLDVAGTVMDAAYLHNKHATPLSFDLWIQLRRLLDWVCTNWERPDRGIWEVRGPDRHFVYSKLMCWVALDRGIRLATTRAFPGNVDRWRHERDRIYEEIMARGWSPARGAFVQHYATDDLDAANLIMPLVFFISPNDPRMARTLAAVQQPPYEGGLLDDFLVYRYPYDRTDDGLRQPEGAFNMCTFWLIEAVTRASRMDPGAAEHARLLFDRMLWQSSRLGLYAEQSSPDACALGNYPQGLTHLSLISAAFNLDRALSPRRP